MQISIETDVRLTDKQSADFKQLFKFLLKRSFSEKGNVTIPFDGHGNFGNVEFKGFHDVRANGNGVSAPVEPAHKG